MGNKEIFLHSLYLYKPNYGKKPYYSCKVLLRIKQNNGWMRRDTSTKRKNTTRSSNRNYEQTTSKKAF